MSVGVMKDYKLKQRHLRASHIFENPLCALSFFFLCLWEEKFHRRENTEKIEIVAHKGTSLHITFLRQTVEVSAGRSTVQHT